jgi:uncharacterized coiled-coil protein SlyX
MSGDAVERITQLEMLVMHLQHDMEQISATAIAQQQEIRELRATIRRLERGVESLQQPAEVRDVLSEVPPHH